MPLRNRFTPVVFVLSLALSSLSCRAEQWTAPTPAELSMTSIPEVPGAPAVFLYKEQTTEDALHMFSYYVRIKVLTEEGKKYSNVELPFFAGAGGISMGDVEGRTIHPDGAVIPFTGKPYEKLIEKSKTYKYMAKVFTLPSVEIGSILEYRYKMRFDDNRLISPDWMVQSELFTRKAHYMWRPTSRLVITSNERGEDVTNTVAWTPILPAGVQVRQRELHGSSSSDAQTEITLDVHDIGPLPHEELMPPLDSISYRVLFYYTSYRSTGEYWAKEGKRWAKARDKFIGPGPAVQKAVKEMEAAGGTPDVRLKRIYDAIMALENTDFTRRHTTAEEHALGLKQVSSAEDVLLRKSGSGDELAQLFVAMARAADFKAFLMAVADRDRRILIPSYLSFNQLDDYIAIVSVNGKDVFFDPGQRRCTFGELAWKHSGTGGLRQTENAVELVTTPLGSYNLSHTTRIADLALDESGMATGTVVLSYTGAPALRWRQESLRGDDTSLNLDLRQDLEQLLPGGMEVRVTNVENLSNSDKPLQVHYQVKGAIAFSTGKRLLVRANLFESNSRPKFASATRELPVDMNYADVKQDAVRLKLPSSLAIESAPSPQHADLNSLAKYSRTTANGAGSLTIFRNLSIGQCLFYAKEYGDLRTFYAKLESADEESVVLTRTSQTASMDGKTR